MFKFFKQKCPICKMELKDGSTSLTTGGKNYPEGYGKKFCSENCKEKYRKKLVKEQSKPSGGCCH